MSFVTELFEKWPYSTDLVRPTHYSLVDQAIGGLMKAPEIVCYIEKIVSYFLQEAAKCRMSTFAFDEEAYYTIYLASIARYKSGNKDMLLFLTSRISWRNQVGEIASKDFSRGRGRIPTWPIPEWRHLKTFQMRLASWVRRANMIRLTWWTSC